MKEFEVKKVKFEGGWLLYEVGYLIAPIWW